MSELGLRPAALLIYALIYSFTEHGQTWHGSCQTLSKRVGITRANVMNALSSLTERGLIKRIGERRVGSGRSIVEYTALDPDDECTESIPSMHQNNTFNVSKQYNERIESIHNNKEDKKEHKKEIDLSAAKGGYRSAGNAFGGNYSYRRDQTNRSYNRALDYGQHIYTKEELLAMGVSFGEEIYE